MLVETHCHLNDAEHFPDPDSEIAVARAAGVEKLIIVGTDPEDGLRALQIAERHNDVYAIVGFHPNMCASYSTARLSELEPLLAHPKTVAVGEIGLDFYRDHAPRHHQFQALYDQLALARDLDLPVVFHCRDAYSELLDILEGLPPHPYLIHCFAGGEEDAFRACDLGCLFGIDGPVTYKKNDGLRELIRQVGLGRFVLETDSPYLSPVPHRGQPNRPAYLPLIAAAIAEALDISVEFVAEVTTANATRFFRLPA
jgi:TatD DNase family protein